MSNSGTLYLGCYTDLAYNLYGEIPIFKTYNRALTTSEIKQNFRHYRTRFGMEYDTFYFVVSNRFTRSYWIDRGYNKIMADTTPAYRIYQKPDANFTGVGTYTQIAIDPVGSPLKNTVLGNQYLYGNGRFFTSVTVRKNNATGELNFEFPDGGTTTYGEAFYKTIITPYVP